MLQRSYFEYFNNVVTNWSSLRVTLQQLRHLLVFDWVSISIVVTSQWVCYNDANRFVTMINTFACNSNSHRFNHSNSISLQANYVRHLELAIQSMRDLQRRKLNSKSQARFQYLKFELFAIDLIFNSKNRFLILLD